MRILMVEDEARLAMIVQTYLEAQGFAVDVAVDGPAGLAALLKGQYDVCVLDVSLPHQNGFEVLAAARKEGVRVPVLFLTARDLVEDRVAGLNAGADDYLVKPFALAELAARIRALMRRGSTQKDATLKAATLVLDPVARTAQEGTAPLDLTPKQFALLECLMLNAGHVVTRSMLLSSVWGYSFDPGTNVVDVHVTLLRKKLQDPAVIQTVRGVGYRLGT